MSWMNIIHKAKTQSGQMITGADRLAPKPLLTGLPSSVPPQIDPQRERAMRSKENLKANLDARMKQVNADIKSKQLEIDNETRGQNNQLKLNRLGKDMNILREKATKMQRQVMMDSGKKQRQAAGLSNNVKNILRTQGNKAPAQSVRQTTENVPRPTGNVALPSVQGTTPTKDPLVGFAQDKGLMPQTTQDVPRPMGNVPTEGAKTFRPPPLPNTKTSAQLSQEAQQRKVTQEATQAASQPTPQQRQRTGPPPKKMTTAQLNQQAQQGQQANIDEQNPYTQQQLDNAKLRQEAREKRAKQYLKDSISPRKRKKAAKAKAKEQARQQKTQQRLAQQQQRQQEKEAKRQAKQNPRAGGQLVRRNPNSSNLDSRLVPRGTGRRQNPVLRPKQTGVPIGKSDELSKSIKNILRR